MEKFIKDFIEHNKSLLNDLSTFFLQTFDDPTLTRSDIAYMSALLSDAGIQNVDSAREHALQRVIDAQIKSWCLSDSGVSALPLYDFIEAFLDSCIGFDENYVLLYITKNVQRWENYIELYKRENITIIERRY